MSKPSIPKGTRDFLPFQVRRRNYIFELIRNTFEKYGYEPIETPSFENLDTLMGKYGEEGDRLIYKIASNKEGAKPDKALRYDLTVPFARFVVQHQNELTFPFKRYQIQAVWRGDRPQKGRYREFYQCDADVVGSDSLNFEVEQIQIFDAVLSELGFKDFTIRVNNRKILSGMADAIGESEKFSDLVVALDKLDKIGGEKVAEEWQQRGIKKENFKRLNFLFKNSDGLSSDLANLLKGSKEGLKGLAEMKEVLDKVKSSGLKKAKLQFDATLARGLNYYTGIIFEVLSNEVKIGSICGGGRYDNLTEMFGGKDMTGVGISFGADRIYDVIEELDRWPEHLQSGVQVVFVNFGGEEEKAALNNLSKLRKKGISSELYPSAAKIQKQMKYAHDKGARYVAMIGSEELKNNQITIKQMESGNQTTHSLDQLTELFT